MSTKRHLTNREVDTLLAALRMWQRCQRDASEREEHLSWCHGDPLDDREIERLFVDLDEGNLCEYHE